MKFRYKFKHLHCSNCLELSTANHCPHQLCPHIMDNLDDLAHDPAFHAAIAAADDCATFHRATLMHLQQGHALCPA